MSWTAAIASVLYVFALLIVLHLDKSACFNFRFDLVIAQLQHDTGSLAIDLQFCRTQVCLVALGEGKHENALPRSLAHRRYGHSGSSCAHRHDHAAFRSSTGLPNERQPWLAKLCHSSWIGTPGPAPRRAARSTGLRLSSRGSRLPGFSTRAHVAIALGVSR